MLKDLFHVTCFLAFERLLHVFNFISNYLCSRHRNNRPGLRSTKPGRKISYQLENHYLEEFYQPKLYNNEQSKTTHPEHNAHVLLLNLICANRMFGNCCRC